MSFKWKQIQGQTVSIIVLEFKERTEPVNIIIGTLQTDQ